MLAAMPWMRNVDELAAMLARAFARVDAPIVRQEDLLPAVQFDGIARRVTPVVSLREARRRFEREYIASVLEQHGWRMSDAARTLGIERANLPEDAGARHSTRRAGRARAFMRPLTIAGFPLAALLAASAAAAAVARRRRRPDPPRRQ
jgi:DNA-binding NtrC family response regulator